VALRGTPSAIRLAELVAAVSYGADLGLGQPMQHCLRQTVISLRLADLVNASEADRAATYYVGLLMNAYCHADAAEQTAWFGDDIAFKGDGVDVLGMNTAQVVSFMLRRAGGHGRAAERARRIATFPAAGQRALMSFVATHSTLGAQFAKQLGFDDTVCSAVAQAYEQWDGKGQPNQLRGEEINLPARLVQFAGPLETFVRKHGLHTAVQMARRRRGRAYDPTIVDAFCANAAEVLSRLDEACEWSTFLDAEPDPAQWIGNESLDQALEAMADLVDLKTPYLAGHSRGVSNLAAQAAAHWGLAPTEVTAIRRAGWIHDLGRLGVSNAVWDKRAPLTPAERERVRMHPYLTERILAQVSGFEEIRQIATRHHERLDGSGYPHGLSGAALTPADRLLAAADAYHTATEPRPHRDARDAETAAAYLRAEARRGALDADAVSAVLRVSGHRAAAARRSPAGLTGREVDVLRLLARGSTNRQIAQQLAISPRTVSNHVEHIYAKLGVTSRAAATLHATQHGLVNYYQPR
jgi:HD-GYP domain-containing protein (c-di-GMP phosphodiesterase class II)